MWPVRCASGARPARPARADGDVCACADTIVSAIVVAVLAVGAPPEGLAAVAGTAAKAASGPRPEVSAPAPGTPQAAKWVKKKINFTYQGFTTHYSCQGLRDKVRDVLLQLGAR